MKVYFIGAGPGDPDLLTIRAERLLKNCRICIYAGSLVSPAVLELIPKDAQRYDSAAMSLEDILSVCQDAQKREIDVARLHSGDPSLYGAIREQMNGLDRLNIEYEVIPGISSFQASAAVLRIELTAPEVAQAVILTRTSGRTPLPAEQELERMAQTHATLCIFLSGHKIEEVANRLATHYGGDCPAAVVYHATWPDQKIIEGVLGDIAVKVSSAGIGQTCVILVGRALSRDIPSSRLYDSTFTHQFRRGKSV